MDFSLLGPVEVRIGGTRRPVGSGRQRFVLGMLLVNAGRLTLTGQLLNGIWGDPPSSAKAQLHNMVSDLRRRLGPEAADVIMSRPSGYELRLGDHRLDLVEFRRRTDAARRAARSGDNPLALALFDEALALWRGPALADAPDEMAATLRQALHEERLAAAVSRLDAAIALHRFDDVLGATTTLLDEYPYQESLWHARMLALAGAGRGADALDTFRLARRRFAKDLGIEPGPRLQQLVRRILRGEVCSAVAVAEPVSPSQLPPVTAGMVTGRADLIGAVQAELIRDGGANVVVLVGPGGVGKTTLALSAAHNLSEAYPDGQLYADLRGSGDDPVDPHVVAGRFLRALGVEGSLVPDDRDERAATLLSRLAGTRTLIVLDDAANERQVRPLLPGAPGCAVLITSRRRLAALVTTARWSVPVLETGDATVLLGRIAGVHRVETEPEAAAAVARLCGHLPLAVCVAAARLSVRPDWTLAAFEALLRAERQRLDGLRVGDLDVRASIGLSYGALGPDLRHLLRRLSLLSAPNWPAWAAGEVAGEPEVGKLLDQLLDVHLVESAGVDRFDQHRFRLHDLVAEYARERMAEEEPETVRTEAVKQVLTGWLALADRADRSLTRTPAQHGSGWPPPVDAPSTAIEQAPLGWFEAERTSLVHAVSTACRAGLTDLGGALALRLAPFLSQRAYNDDWRRTLREATDGVRLTGPDGLLLKLLGALFAASLKGSSSANLVAIATEERAVAQRLGDRQAEVSALTNAGWALRKGGWLPESTERLEQALARSDSRTPARVRTRAMHGLAMAYREAGNYPPAVPLVEQALALERGQGNPGIVARGLINYAAALADAGRPDEAGHALNEAVAVAADLTSTDIVITRAHVDHRGGRWDAASDGYASALEFAETHADHAGTAEALIGLADVAYSRGVPSEAVLRRALELWRDLGRELEAARAMARLDRALGTAEFGDEWRRILAEHRLTEASLRLD